MTLPALTGMDWLNVVAFALTIVGFAVTWLQLHRTKTAAEAAQVAGETVRGQLQDVQLAWLLPRFQEIESELEEAEDAAAARQALTKWRGVAPQAEAIIKRDAEAPLALAMELRTTVAFAVSAQQSLLEGADMREALGVVLLRIRTCNDSMAVYVADITLSLRPGYK